MSEKKKQNSLIFLTTLSVYLGLVLVGGANSPVLAQAALTRNFDIQEEIEYRDDLDKNPDDAACSKPKPQKDNLSNQFFEHYAKTILALLKQDFKLVPAASLKQEFRIVDQGLNLDLSTVTTEFDELFNELSQKVNKKLADNGFIYTLNSDNFFSSYKLKPKIEGRDVSSFVDLYNSRLNSLLKQSKNESENLILKNTEIVFVNNQIFIITNLPRASIDSLLAEKDAK